MGAVKDSPQVGRFRRFRTVFIEEDGGSVQGPVLDLGEKGNLASEDSLDPSRIRGLLVGFVERIGKEIILELAVVEFVDVDRLVDDAGEGFRVFQVELGRPAGLVSSRATGEKDVCQPEPKTVFHARH